MAVATRGTSSNYLQRAPSPSGLADVLDVILDKGLVIDAYVRVSVIGIEVLTIDARIVIASVDTYLRFAEAVNRLDLAQTEMAAIESPLKTTDIRLKRRDLHRHLHVIEAAFKATTIIPCAFGTTVESGAELEEGVLAGARDDLLAGLDRLNGTVQMNVKATYDE